MKVTGYQMILLDGKEHIVDATVLAYIRSLEGRIGKHITEKEALRAELAEYEPTTTLRLKKTNGSPTNVESKHRKGMSYEV